jgi:hypothetical protein
MSHSGPASWAGQLGRLAGEVRGPAPHPVGAALASDVGAQRAMALTVRYRAQAEGEVRRALEALYRHRRAAAAGLLDAKDAPEPLPEATTLPNEPKAAFSMAGETLGVAEPALAVPAPVAQAAWRP